MFLRSLEAKNPRFVEAAIELHQSGRIPANSYVVDVGTVAENARAIIAEARRHGLTVFPMTKQFGRNPKVLEAISAQGADAYVAVDMACARGICGGGFPLGHVGHLVQIPQHEIAEALEMEPQYWTVFGLAQAKAISRAAIAAGRTQKLLLRVYRRGDVVVHTHAGGFSEETIDSDLDAISALPGVAIAGVTTYPSAQFDRLTRQVVPTPNVAAMQRVAEKMRARGITDVQVNMASELSVGTIPTAAEGGATQIEPGHAFTDTSPYQVFAVVPERQAIVYLTEVSHESGGGGFLLWWWALRMHWCS